MDRGILSAMVALAALVAWPTGMAPAGMAPDPRPGDTLLGKEGGLAYVSDAEGVTNPEYTEALAACPQTPGPWRIAGGGFQISGSEPESGFTLSASRPLDLLDAYGDNDDDNDDYWQASGDAPLTSTFESFAVCAKSNRLKQKRLDVPDSPSSDRSVTFRCSRGRISGGGGFIATSDSFISSIFPADGKRWKVRLFDTVGGNGGMEAWVICARGFDLDIRRDSSRVPAGESRASFVRCPSGSHVIGGGAKSTGAADAMNLYASYPLDLTDPGVAPDDAWQANAYNRSATAKKIKAYVICAE